MLRLLEGFESYGTLGRSGITLRDDVNKALYVDTTGVELVDGRGSGLALEMFAARYLYLNRFDPLQSDTWIMGFAMKVSDTTTSLSTFWQDIGSGLQLRAHAGGGLSLDQLEWTIPIALPFSIAPRRWYYFEIKFYAHASAGTVEVRVNGNTIYSGTSLDTKYSTAVPGSQIRLGSLVSSGTLETAFDDIYICDGTGSYNNDFLGPIAVETLRPSSDDGTQNWTPSAGGDHYALVDSANTWQTTEYVEASTAVDDLWGYPSLGIITGTVHGIQVMTTAWTDTGLPQTLETICDSGATVDYSDPRGMGASQIPTPLDTIWEVDPNTSAPWTATNLNAASFGIRKV